MGAHFSETGLRFLRGLKRNNDRDWFNERKSIYERELKHPLLALIEEINEGMLDYAPEHVRPPGKIMMRIYRDIRFAKDKRPYKTHVSAWWAKTGHEKTSGGGFYVQVAGDEVQMAAGVFMPERAQLLALRGLIVTQHAQLRRELHHRQLKAVGLTAIAGNPLTRPPKGFNGPPEALDLLTCREWGVTGSFPVEVAISPGFGKEITRRFRKAASLVALLNEPLGARPKGVSFSPLPLR